LAVLTLGIFIISVPPYFHHGVQALDAAEHTTLSRIGLTADLYIGYGVALEIIRVLVYFLAAAAIFRRRSDDWMSVFVSMALLTFGVVIAPNLDTPQDISPVYGVLVFLVPTFGMGSLLFAFFLFPDGRFIPRWTRVLALFWVGWQPFTLALCSRSSGWSVLSPVSSRMWRLSSLPW
jgi:hypothetical protein